MVVNRQSIDETSPHANTLPPPKTTHIHIYTHAIETHSAVTASACLTGTIATWPGTRAATPLPDTAPVAVRYRRRACSPVRAVVVGFLCVWGGGVRG